MKIISLVPSLTELLFDLGLEEEVVGITKFCVHPSDWRKKKTIIGGTKNFRFEEIDNLSPDLIIANKEENYKDGIEKLQSKYQVLLTDIYSIEDSLDAISKIGELTNRVNEAKKINSKIEDVFKKLKNKISGNKVAYLIWNNPIMAVGNNNFIHSMMKHFGFKNVFESKERYPETTVDELIRLSPDFLFLSSEPFPFSDKHIVQFQDEIKNCKVILVDGEYFSWYGSRLMKGFNYFQKLFVAIR